jgi:GntR family galactonate operon transcriptional repressor
VTVASGKSFVEGPRARTYPRRGMHGEIVHRIGFQIVSGQLLPGHVLAAEETIDGERVSRTAFREMVKVLAAKGLLVSKQNVGTRVRPRSDWNLFDPDILSWQLESGLDLHSFAQMTELRLLIEPAAARLAAERATAEEVAKLTSSFRLMTEAGSDHERYVTADLDFHQTILAACHNDMIEQLGSILRELFRLTFAFSARIPDAAVSALDLHEKILVAIQSRSAEDAGSSMIELLTHTAGDVERALIVARPSTA